MIKFISIREKQVLELISLEYSTKEIAQMLHISHHTATTHRKSLLSKLDVKNTAGMIRRAYEEAILTFTSRT